MTTDQSIEAATEFLDRLERAGYVVTVERVGDLRVEHATCHVIDPATRLGIEEYADEIVDLLRARTV